ncbi:hypothetical protein BH11PLA1_BH11PLA1_12210 [soil metagenome]
MSHTTEAGLIGVDISARAICAVQLGEGRAPALRAAACAARPLPAAFETDARFCAGLLRRRGFAGNRIVLAAPTEKLLHATLELPPRSSGAPIEELAAAELGRIHRVEAAALQVSVCELPTSGKADQSGYLAAALPSADGEALVAAFADEGLIVETIDLRLLAIARACARIAAAPGALTPVLLLEPEGHTLAALWKGQAIYERRLDAPELRAIDSILSEAHVGDAAVELEIMQGARRDGTALEPALAELAGTVHAVMTRHALELVNQLRLSLAYAAQLVPEAELNAITLIGPLAHVPAIAEVIERVLGLEVRVLTLADAAGVPGLTLPDAGGPAAPLVALGLALPARLAVGTGARA